MDSTSASLKTIAQGVINSLFAKRFIRCAPAVREVVKDEERYRFAIHIDDSQVSLIKVALEPDEFFAEAVHRVVLRRLATRERQFMNKPRIFNFDSSVISLIYRKVIDAAQKPSRA